MTTTLIVRDATLAINGAQEKRGEPRSHLQLRLVEAARMDERLAEECVEVLSSVATGEEADPEALEALVLVGLALPGLAKRLNLPTLATGRRLAARLERAGEVERTIALLELLQKHFPGQESLEHDLAQLMRRQGMVQDLVGRYFERAQRLVREGRSSEAAGWLREVLQLDPGRRDAARMLRDLRFKKANRKQKRGGWLRSTIGIVLLSLGLAFVVLRERRLREQFEGLQAATPGSVTSLHRRLSELEQFADRNPIWHGAFQLLTERSSLRVQLAVLEERERQIREEKERVERERLEAAGLYRDQAWMRAQSGDVQGAIEAFRKALEAGGPAWAHYAEAEKNLADLEANQSNQP